MHRRLSWLLSAACVIQGGATCGCGTSKASEGLGEIRTGDLWLAPADLARENVTFGKVLEHPVDDSLVTSGRIMADDQRIAHVFSPVNGKIVHIEAHAQLGQHVETGQDLAILESPDIGTVVSDLHKAEADHTAARHDFRRETELDARDATSKRAVEVAQDTLSKAKAELERASKKADLLRVRSYDGVTQRFALVSPISGSIVARTVSPGIEVQGQYANGTPVELFTIVDLDDVWVMSDIYEIDLARVRAGMGIDVTVLAYPGRVFKGRVDWVSGSLDPQTRTAKVRCNIDNRDHALRPEMYATVKIATQSANVVAIPRAAVARLGEYTFVFVETARKADGTVRLERVPIRVDDTGGAWLPVLGGVGRDATIATSGIPALVSKI